MRKLFTFLFIALITIFVNPPAIAAGRVCISTSTSSDLPTLTYTSYSDNIVRQWPVLPFSLAHGIAAVEALPDSKVITVQHFGFHGTLISTDVYTRQAQGSSVWIHTSF